MKRISEMTREESFELVRRLATEVGLQLPPETGVTLILCDDFRREYLPGTKAPCASNMEPVALLSVLQAEIDAVKYKHQSGG